MRVDQVVDSFLFYLFQQNLRKKTGDIMEFSSRGTL